MNDNSAGAEKIKNLKNQKNQKKSDSAMIVMVMMVSIIISISVVFVAEVLYLINHHGIVHLSHVFSGEPKRLEDVNLIVSTAFQGSIKSLLQFGVLLILINPIVRVAITAYNFKRQHNKCYVVISLMVLVVLLISFFSPDFI
ncbi:DUF1634 domain-containing protein [Cysteiniphilum sp. JM-1]|uniref:DUF1634 domain-containing protein n=1 Tax=Cysteiniphilum sp. JM-1 TaxID=2610891 RepID=UPI0012463902|nr:DUF1634 domain-containing protein [Cysteiniphilum sp. JM-1]